MKQHLRPALMLLLLLTLITGVIYPLAVTGIARAFFPGKANGSLIEQGDHQIGSALIGQQFVSAKYFWGRLSATSPTPYNAAASSGSNYGPLNKALLDASQGRVDQLRKADSANTKAIPIDLVTASASGLDPHISVAGALYQVARVARERNTSETNIRTLVEQFTEPRQLGFLGEPRVNVLQLNLALDAMTRNSGGTR